MPHQNFTRKLEERLETEAGARIRQLAEQAGFDPQQSVKDAHVRGYIKALQDVFTFVQDIKKSLNGAEPGAGNPAQPTPEQYLGDRYYDR